MNRSAAVFLDVALARLAVADGGGSVQLMGAEFGGHARPGIEEIPFLVIVERDGARLVVPAHERVADMPVLQVRIGRQPRKGLILGAEERAHFLFGTRVPVPGIIPVHRRVIVIRAQEARPQHLAPVPADIP